MNQHLETDILYTAPIGQPITELRITGDKLVLYTESNELYKRLKLWKQIIHWTKYTKGASLVGVDLYFPKSARKALLRALAKDPRTSKEAVSAR